MVQQGTKHHIPVTSRPYLQFKQANDENLYWLVILTVNTFREMQK